MVRPHVLCLLLLLVTCLLAPDQPVLAHGPADSSPFAGLEISPGVRIGEITYGAAFVCRTLPVEGVCEATVRYRGTPGLGSQVTLLGGQWAWKQTRTDITYSGRVLGGLVVWPSTLTTPGYNGQPGVAQVTMTLALDHSATPSGNIAACLDDTHRAGRLDPATFTGVITLLVPH